MEFTLSDQLLCFFSSVLCGLGLGIFYEFLRIFRIILNGKKIFVFFCDVVFMVICAFITVLFSICYSRGVTRYFTVAGELTGVLSVRFTLGRLSIRFLEPLLRKIRENTRKIAVNTAKIAKKPLQVIGNILYNKNRKNGTTAHVAGAHKIKRRGKRYHEVKTAE